MTCVEGKKGEREWDRRQLKGGERKVYRVQKGLDAQ